MGVKKGEPQLSVRLQNPNRVGTVDNAVSPRLAWIGRHCLRLSHDSVRNLIAVLDYNEINWFLEGTDELITTLTHVRRVHNAAN